jgi:Uncharacterized protein conserved in bacteria (DUF2130)
MQLMIVAAARVAAAGAKQKSKVLYEYVVASPQFRQRVEAIAQAFIGMQAGLQKEKRTVQRQRAKREKQIKQVLSNSAGMYGELRALTGLPDIVALTAGATVDTAAETKAIVLELPPTAVKSGKIASLPLRIRLVVTSHDTRGETQSYSGDGCSYRARRKFVPAA